MTPAAAVRSLVRTAGWGSRGRRAGPRARARSAVLTGLVLVAAANLGLAAVVETRRPEWRDPEYFHRQKQLTRFVRWDREQRHARPLVVILGGSRPQMGLSPDHLGLGGGPTDPRVFSLTQSGTVPAGARLNAARLFASGISPDFVLVEVLPPVLTDPDLAHHPVPTRRLGCTDLAAALPYHSHPVGTVGSWVVGRAAPLSSLRVPLVAHARLADVLPPGSARSDFLWTDMRPTGWSPFYPAAWTAADWGPRLTGARKAYTRRLAHDEVLPEHDRAVRDTLAACRARGVNAALFTMPESAGFRAAYPPGRRELLLAHVAVLGRECGVPVFDTSDWDFREDEFMDGHHLLGPAAEAFSARFGRECVGPWVRGRIGP